MNVCRSIVAVGVVVGTFLSGFFVDLCCQRTLDDKKTRRVWGVGGVKKVGLTRGRGGSSSVMDDAKRSNGKKIENQTAANIQMAFLFIFLGLDSWCLSQKICASVFYLLNRTLRGRPGGALAFSNGEF